MNMLTPDRLLVVRRAGSRDTDVVVFREMAGPRLARCVDRFGSPRNIEVVGPGESPTAEEWVRWGGQLPEHEPTPEELDQMAEDSAEELDQMAEDSVELE